MRMYKCIKTVGAFKIAKITAMPPKEVNIEDAEGMGVLVEDAYIEKHDPQVGGYYVRYEDNYESFSPAEAFEKGYVEITKSREELLRPLSCGYCQGAGCKMCTPPDPGPGFRHG